MDANAWVEKYLVANGAPPVMGAQMGYVGIITFNNVDTTDDIETGVVPSLNPWNAANNYANNAWALELNKGTTNPNAVVLAWGGELILSNSTGSITLVDALALQRAQLCLQVTAGNKRFYEPLAIRTPFPNTVSEAAATTVRASATEQGFSGPNGMPDSMHKFARTLVMDSNQTCRLSANTAITLANGPYSWQLNLWGLVVDSQNMQGEAIKSYVNDCQTSSEGVLALTANSSRALSFRGSR